jgi:hypothetical protein
MSRQDTVMALARRLAAMVVECVRMYPGQRRAFYVEKLGDVASILINGERWPTKEHLFEKAFFAAQKAGSIKYGDGAWYPAEVVHCPHCKRPWPEAPEATS